MRLSVLDREGLERNRYRRTILPGRAGRTAGLPGEEVQALIDEAFAAVRSEFWSDRSW
jgi:hypothetical protein